MGGEKEFAHDTRGLISGKAQSACLQIQVKTLAGNDKSRMAYQCLGLGEGLFVVGIHVQR